ncbi:hypothetical protein GW17_00020079, partial [Ensete ventricosum]
IADFHILSKASREVSKFATIALVDLVPKRLLVDVESEDLVEGRAVLIFNSYFSHLFVFTSPPIASSSPDPVAGDRP